MLQIAYQTRQREVTLQASGHVQTVSLERMLLIDEVEGSIRQIQRRQAHSTISTAESTAKGLYLRSSNNFFAMHIKYYVVIKSYILDASGYKDARGDMIKQNRENAENLVKLLFPIIVEIDGSPVLIIIFNFQIFYFLLMFQNCHRRCF